MGAIIFFLTMSAVLLGWEWHLAEKFADRYYFQIARSLESYARLIVPQVSHLPLNRPTPELASLCRRLGEASATRITILKTSGDVLCDTDEAPDRMENHGDRPEVLTALRGGAGLDKRKSATLDVWMIYSAVPVNREGRVAGIVRAAVPLEFINQSLKNWKVELLAGGLFFAALWTGFAWYFFKKADLTLHQIKAGVGRFSRGDFSEPIPLGKVGEWRALPEELNKMAAQWSRMLDEITAERGEREAMLASMMEGVFAVDSEENVIGMNGAAAKIFNVDPAQAQGASIQQIVRNPRLIEFIGRVLAGHGQIEDVIDLWAGDEDRSIQVHGTALENFRGEGMGALIVLNDVTRLRRLETLRRDFVANVSHELKTPITSIKGWVETLLDGAMKDPDEARRFLEIVARQSDRLNAIIEDLLSLSRIEQESERSEVALERGDVLEAIRAAAMVCRDKADKKNVSLEIQRDDEISARINPPLLEQALVNLIDNAIKYSEEGQSVYVEVKKSESEIVVSVRDEGCGIPKEHLPRLFERFYRVDKARSRQLGGTGLGLAIVKHIAQAHRGKVSVDSVPGSGSRFNIHLPTRS